MIVPNFESVYRVPAAHRLELLRSRSVAGALRGEYWEHGEFDARGQLVARYEAFEERGAVSDGLQAGWRKYDAAGRLVDQGSLEVNPA